MRHLQFLGALLNPALRKILIRMNRAGPYNRMNLIPPTVVFDSYFRYVWQFSDAVRALIGRATVGR
ncbi:MAG: hypothetical protein LC776_03885 [Acidobacteria bacterium]|nr:hypothetical protein [Acidobacteriota bacterium]